MSEWIVMRRRGGWRAENRYDAWTRSPLFRSPEAVHEWIERTEREAQRLIRRLERGKP